MPWVRVANEIDSRRKELGLSPKALAEKANVSVTTVKNLIHHAKDSYGEHTTMAVCKALGWTPTSIEAILNGGTPTVMLPPKLHMTADEAELVEKILELIRHESGPKQRQDA